MRHKYILFLLLIIVFTSGCASKRYAKKGKEFEQAGYYQKAAEMYYYSVRKNAKNVEAQIGLKKNGQLTLNQKLSHFNRLYNSDNTKDAVYKFLEAEKYYKQLEQIGTTLNFPSHYKDYYEDVKETYLEELYGEALLLLDEEKFTSAESLFSEIQTIEPGYMDVSELKKTAHYEPIYRQAKTDLLNMKYRSAYYGFDKILNKLNQYKDARELKQEALSKALITIAMLDFKGTANYASQIKQLEASLQKELTASSSPFIKLVDRENTNTIKDEQLLTLEGKVNSTISANAGKMLGVRALLTGEINNFSVVKGSLKKHKKTGYIKEKIVTKKGETEEVTYKYHKTNYYEYTQTNHVSCGFQFKLISAETGEILVADSFTKTADDKIHFAEFKGNKKNLVPGHWESIKRDSPKDEVKDDTYSKRKLDRLLNAPREIKPVESLTHEVNAAIASKTARKIENYDPEKN